MKFAVLVFPGTWSDGDCEHVLKHELKQDVDRVWHTETDLSGYQAIVLPGGFSYGDYLRCGAIARFSPVMDAVRREADRGKPIIGICNGFQILCEAGLLPGVLTRNTSTQFRCEPVNLRVETNRSMFTVRAQDGDVLEMPVSHGEGCYYAPPDTLTQLNEENRVVFRYSTEEGESSVEAILEGANPNGSIQNIAGILNEQRNVLGMMPHPERAGEGLLGSTDGNLIWNSVIYYVYSHA